MKRALIYYKETEAGILTEDEEYVFEYMPSYLSKEGAKPISLTLPLRAEPYRSKILFPFFDGLIPEGWLLDIAKSCSDISSLNRMELLLMCCRDCIGAVSVIEIKEEKR